VTYIVWYVCGVYLRTRKGIQNHLLVYKCTSATINIIKFPAMLAGHHNFFYDNEVEGNGEIAEVYEIFNIFVQRECTKLRKTTSLQFRQSYWIL
jgi:hypothetical protein